MIKKTIYYMLIFLLLIISCVWIYTIKESITALQLKTPNVIPILEYFSGLNKNFNVKKIPNMHFSRGNGQKTFLLENGKVLIIGGDEAMSVELFDPETNTFSIVTDSIKKLIEDNKPKNYSFKHVFPYHDSYNAIIPLPDGTIYYLRTVYDPETNTISYANKGLAKKLRLYSEKISDMENRVGLPYTTFSNGNVLFIISTFNNNTPDYMEVYLYDPIHNVKYKTAKLHFYRRAFFSFYLTKEMVILSLGSIYNNDDKRLRLSNLEVYNPIIGKVSVVDEDLDKDTIYFKIFEINKPNNNDKITCKQIISPIDYQLLDYGDESRQISVLDCNQYLKLIIYNGDSSTLLKSRNILYIADGDVRLFDLVNEKDYQINKVQSNYVYQKLTTLKDGRILITGGKVSNSDRSKKFESLTNQARIITFKEGYLKTLSKLNGGTV